MDNFEQVLMDAVSSGKTTEVKEILSMEPEFLFQFFSIVDMYKHIAENGTREHLEWFDAVLVRYSTSVEKEVRKELDNVEPFNLRGPVNIQTAVNSPQNDDAYDREFRIEKMVYERIYLYEGYGFGNRSELIEGYKEIEWNEIQYDHLHYIGRCSAIRNKHPDVMEYLIEKVKDWIILYDEIYDGDIRDLEIVTNYELKTSLKYGGKKVAQLLLDSYGCFRKEIFEHSMIDIVYDAISDNNKDVVKLLHDNNFNTEYTFNKGKTSLMLAAENENVDMFKYLLSIDHDFETFDKYGNTVLSYALNSRDEVTIAYVISILKDKIAVAQELVSHGGEKRHYPLSTVPFEKWMV